MMLYKYICDLKYLTYKYMYDLKHETVSLEESFTKLVLTQYIVVSLS